MRVETLGMASGHSDLLPIMPASPLMARGRAAPCAQSAEIWPQGEKPALL
eukprot:CAMPEP_0171229988 /NCGR_PEP_ID=MMETSP0790-20130122/39165_1 /TAXON_ID=2925 /ORGANISM="Alexandrium catenella, Strain OF101" /LENGTH=49 /DNA_ID= /DNA_START= /DNA_END= /DNA_ORIENTATION=